MRAFPPICKDCENRKVGCHDYCAAYLKTKTEYDRRADEERKLKKYERDINGVEHDCKIRIKERTRRDGRKYGRSNRI